jgi:hypothetical protein
MPQARVLRRKSGSCSISPISWANALAFALRFEWNPSGQSTAYLADGFTSTDEEATKLAEAWDRAFGKALRDPLSYYPTRVDMAELSVLLEFVREGAFTITTDK